MTSFLAFPPAREVCGALRVPSSKSASNRALVLAALSETPITIVRPLDSGDTRALAACLTAMGAVIDPVPGGLSVRGPLGTTSERITDLDAADSGTAARFLAAIAAGTPGDFRLSGSPRLSQRPMGPLVAALRLVGANVAEEGDAGALPLRIRGAPLRGGSVRVDASQSSQFLSALLLLGATGGPLEVGAEGSVASAPYAAMTVEALRAFGHRVDGEGPWTVRRGSATPDRYETPGDFSSAVPLLASTGVCGGEVALSGLAWPSADADARAVPVLEEMGIEIAREADGLVARARRGRMRPVSIHAGNFPDSVPALAALAAFAPGESRFDGIGHLRIKESDRLAALAVMLARAGTPAAADATRLIVRGGGRAGEAGQASLPTFRDHRIAMAGGLLALGRPGLRIEDPDCVSKSYPEFFRDLDGLCRR